MALLAYHYFFLFLNRLLDCYSPSIFWFCTDGFIVEALCFFFTFFFLAGVGGHGKPVRSGSHRGLGGVRWFPIVLLHAGAG